MCSILRPIHGLHRSVRYTSNRRRHIAAIPSPKPNAHRWTSTLPDKARSVRAWTELLHVTRNLSNLASSAGATRPHRLHRLDRLSPTVFFFMEAIKFTIESSYTYLRNEYWLETTGVWVWWIMRMSTLELRNTQTVANTSTNHAHEWKTAWMNSPTRTVCWISAEVWILRQITTTMCRQLTARSVPLCQ